VVSRYSPNPHVDATGTRPISRHIRFYPHFEKDSHLRSTAPQWELMSSLTDGFDDTAIRHVRHGLRAERTWLWPLSRYHSGKQCCGFVLGFGSRPAERIPRAVTNACSKARTLLGDSESNRTVRGNLQTRYGPDCE
jgi:hypothetical protein